LWPKGDGHAAWGGVSSRRLNSGRPAAGSSKSLFAATSFGRSRIPFTKRSDTPASKRSMSIGSVWVLHADPRNMANSGEREEALGRGEFSNRRPINTAIGNRRSLFGYFLRPDEEPRKLWGPSPCPLPQEEEFLPIPHPAPRIPHPAPRIPHPAPRIPHHESRIPHPASRITHPASRTTHPASRIPHHASASRIPSPFVLPES
jgi:hypothetical protein